MKIFKYVIMMISLAVTGIVFAVAGALIGGNILGNNAVEFGALGLAIIGALAGYLLGIILGIVIIKRVFCRKSSLLAGISGVIIGTAAVVFLAEPLKLISNTNLLIGVYLIVVTFFSVGGLCLKK